MFNNEKILLQRNEGSSSIRYWGNRVLARTNYSSRGTAISLNSISGFDGLSTSIPRGRQGTETIGGLGQERKKMKHLKRHPVTTTWCLMAVIIGSYLQGWLHFV